MSFDKTYDFQDTKEFIIKKITSTKLRVSWLIATASDCDLSPRLVIFKSN